MSKLGLDSLDGIEILDRVEREYGVQFACSESNKFMHKNSTLGMLSELIEAEVE